ncbi:MAG: isocitrate/isopropylmalate dehydrogenase family protein [Bryobacteraceae bacterium]
MSKLYKIAVLPGDGIGPDVIAETLKVLHAVKSRVAGLDFQFDEFSVGAGEYLKSGDPLPAATLEAIKQYDAILLGAMGLPDVRWPNGTEMAPQLDIREKLDLYLGVRPIRLYSESDTPLKGYKAGDIDFVLIRESTEGLFFSRLNPFDPDAPEVRDTLRISRHASERLFRAAFKMAESRRGLVTLIDKANVLPSMAYFRRIFNQVAEEFPKVRAEHVYVDAMNLYLVQRPERFDVVVTENMFGDILSDLAAGIVGGMGMAPSGDIGDKYAVFQPSHGSAPDIAGKGIANPVATILSAAMMLEWFNDPLATEGAKLIRASVQNLFECSTDRSADLGGKLTTTECGDRIAGYIQQ